MHGYHFAHSFEGWLIVRIKFNDVIIITCNIQLHRSEILPTLLLSKKTRSGVYFFGSCVQALNAYFVPHLNKLIQHVAFVTLPCHILCL